MSEKVGVAIIGLGGAVATTAVAGIEMIKAGSNDSPACRWRIATWLAWPLIATWNSVDGIWPIAIWAPARRNTASLPKAILRTGPVRFAP